MIKRHVQPSRQHFFLFGPRGTGKSTWLHDFYPGAAFIDLLLPDSYRDFFTRPERLVDFVKANEHRKIIIIDEIQRVPQMLPLVHSLIDKQPELQFILTGSSARKLKRTDTDLLGGRAGIKRMHPFTVLELGGGFSIDKSLENGLIPVVHAARDPRQALAGYIQIYLDQEVKAEAIVRNVENFARFLEAISFSQGCVINVANIARECQVQVNSVRNYIAILKDLLISHTITPFRKRMKRNIVSHEKFFYFDCGVFRSLRPAGPLDRPEEIDGAALETLVCQNLLAWIDNSENSAKLHFWRTSTGQEVDFVVYGPGHFFAIEVKNTDRIRPEDLRGLKTFAADYPEAKPIFLYRGDERIETEGILCVNLEEYLRTLG
ncbi:MAG: ATP-binding protein [Chitinispirillaceae bacterium]|nr:ATP-binding protein [Chitinispirillaceae bacterium]